MDNGFASVMALADFGNALNTVDFNQERLLISRLLGSYRAAMRLGFRGFLLNGPEDVRKRLSKSVRGIPIS